MRLDFASLVRTGKTLAFLQREGIDTNKVHLVANRCNAAVDVPLRKAQEALGRPITQSIPDNPRSPRRRTTWACLSCWDAPTSNMAKAIRELAHQVSATRQ